MNVKQPMVRAVSPVLFAAAAMTILAARDGTPPAVEKWADPHLTVTRGLVVWLDAARLPEARKAAGLAELRDSDPIDLWPDVAGRKHDVSQKRVEAQPRYRPTGDFHAVRFDGAGSYLRRSGAGQSFENLTVFVVAAPYSCPEW